MPADYKGILAFHGRQGIAAAVLLCLFLTCVLLDAPAFAQTIPDGTCSTDPEFLIPIPAPGSGIISMVIGSVAGVLNTVAMAMYNYITASVDYREVIAAALTLYVVIYGALFIFGMVQLTVNDMASRVLKIAIIVLLFTPGSWGFFYATVGSFFNDGTNELIAEMNTIAVGTVPGLTAGDPFAIFDYAVNLVTSSRMTVSLMAMAVTGPYGLLFAVLIFVSLGTFIAALFQVIWVYLMALVVRTFLLALAPIFLATILFTSTRHLFEGWLNHLVNTLLQPVLLFTYFAFFSQLVQSSLVQILRVPVCWVPLDPVAGSSAANHLWRYVVENPPGSGTYELFFGNWTWTGADQPDSKIFPIEVVDVLQFLILTQLALRFNNVVLSMAMKLAAAPFSFQMSGALSKFFSSNQGAGIAALQGGMMAKNYNTMAQAAGRAGPGARRHFREGAAAGVGARPGV